MTSEVVQGPATRYPFPSRIKIQSSFLLRSHTCIIPGIGTVEGNAGMKRDEVTRCSFLDSLRRRTWVGLSPEYRRTQIGLTVIKVRFVRNLISRSTWLIKMGGVWPWVVSDC